MDIAKANEAISGGPGVLNLGGKTYLVGQPDDRTFTTLLSHLRGRATSPIQAVAEDLNYLTNPLDRAAAIKAAVELKAGGGAEITNAFIQDELLKPEGCAFLTWLLIRKAQPDVKLDEIKPLVTSDNVTDILAALMSASGLEAVVAGKAGRNGSAVGSVPASSPSTAAP